VHDPYGSPYASGPIGPRRGGPALGIAVGTLLALATIAGLWAHNGLVTRREGVDAAWAQIETQCQRRADLVPQLVELLKRQLRHERETLHAVIAARGEALARRVDALEAAHGTWQREAGGIRGAALDRSERLVAVARAEAALRGELQGVFALAESYPELRSADQFLGLQAQLEGTENRIGVARQTFNDAVRDYNAMLEQIPTRWFAEARGWTRRAYYEVDPASRHAPVLALD
jgi:LemA protein